MLDGLAVVLPPAVLQEVQERHSLAFRTAIDHRIIDTDYGTRYGACCSERRAQIGARQLCDNLFKCSEKEYLVLNDRSANGSAKLVAAKILEWFSVRSCRSKRFRAEIFEAASVDLIRSRLCNDVDNASRCAPEFRVGPACDHLKFLDRVECDVNRSALSAELLAEEAVVVVATIEADVIEYAALTVEINLV